MDVEWQFLRSNSAGNLKKQTWPLEQKWLIIVKVFMKNSRLQYTCYLDTFYWMFKISFQISISSKNTFTKTFLFCHCVSNCVDDVRVNSLRTKELFTVVWRRLWKKLFSYTLLSSIVFLQEWGDEKLKWNASDYGGLSKVHFADHEVWQPDVMLYNR